MRPLITPESVIDSRLAESLQRTLGLEQLRAGRHVLRNAQRLRIGEVVVRKLWVAEVQPPVTPAFCLAAVVTKERTSIILALLENPEGQASVVPEHLERKPEWPDPVAEALAAVDLWSGGSAIPMGGCSYALFVDTPQMHTAMRFGNPRQSSRLALQLALLTVGKLFVKADPCSSAAAVIGRWEAAVASNQVP